MPTQFNDSLVVLLQPTLCIHQLIMTSSLHTIWAFLPSSFGKKTVTSWIRIAAGPRSDSSNRRVAILRRWARDQLDLEYSWYTHLGLLGNCTGQDRVNVDAQTVSRKLFASHLKGYVSLPKKDWVLRKHSLLVQNIFWKQGKYQPCFCILNT